MSGYLADLCGGRGGVAREATRCGLRGRLWDTSVAPHLDVTLRSTWNVLRCDAASRQLRAVMLAPECKSWSTMQFLATPVRSQSSPWGVPGLAPPRLLAVQRGNTLMRASLKLIRMLLRFHVPFALEHPGRSLFWATSEAQALERHPAVQSVVIDQCAFGTRWRKRTRIMFGFCDGLDLDALATRRCRTSGVCAHTGRPHVHLIGTAPGSSVKLTAIAQTYPASLAQNIATILVAAARDQHS